MLSHEQSKLVRGGAAAGLAWARSVADAVAEGKLVVFPLETVYCVAAGGGSAGRDRLRAATGHAGASTWHVADAVAALDRLCAGAGVQVSALHRRLVGRLSPGPVRFELELGEAAGAAAAAVGLAPGAADTDGVVSFRAPDDEAARAIWAAGAVVASGVVGAGWSADGRSLDEAAVERAFDAGVLASAFDGGATRLGLASTTVRLTAGGGYSVGAIGAVPEGFVHRAAVRRVLFVCTGNTCRSPMAEAIGRHLLSSGAVSDGGVPTEVASAGVSAFDGGSASAEVFGAMERAGVAFDGSHRSRALTASMLREADAVFAMTAAHASAAMAIDAGSAGKIRAVDPAGDVPDPIGQGQAAYDHTAARLMVTVERALRSVAEEDAG